MNKLFSHPEVFYLKKQRTFSTRSSVSHHSCRGVNDTKTSRSFSQVESIIDRNMSPCKFELNPENLKFEEEGCYSAVWHAIIIQMQISRETLYGSMHFIFVCTKANLLLRLFFPSFLTFLKRFSIAHSETQHQWNT